MSQVRLWGKWLDTYHEWLPRFLSAEVATLSEIRAAFAAGDWYQVEAWKDEWHTKGGPEIPGILTTTIRAERGAMPQEPQP